MMTKLNHKDPKPSCRFCASPLEHTFVDLGMSPLCESFLAESELNHMEPFYPLHVYVCGSCFLVQLEEYVSPESIFSNYAYFSSYSDSWLRHAQSYVTEMIERFSLNSENRVIELASNDGYLLQYFVEKSIPVLGVEPAANVAEAAVQKGVPTVVKFFSEQTAKSLVADGIQADLLVGNNVLAQVPDLNDFVRGMKVILKPAGIITMEFPHLSKLMEQNQFDTIYHEHFSYFSFQTARRIFEKHGLRIFDVQELKSHGGSLRIFATHQENKAPQSTTHVSSLGEREITDGILSLLTYSRFEEKVKETKRKLLEFLIHAKREGKSVVGYGAPGKGNTLLNYCGIRTDFIEYTVDRNPYKHEKYLPGTHIPIFAPEKVWETRPDYLLILPWNLKDEIMLQMSSIRDWGGQFVVPIPEVRIYS